jgi:RND family efflux transporter MFP subunit
MKKTTARILIGVGILSIVLIVCSFLWGKENSSQEIKWETLPVKRSDISTSILATGIIKPQVGAEVKIGSRASGTVTELYVNIGDQVKKGQLLAELDNSEYKALVRQSQANLNYSKVNVKYSEIEYNRIQNLAQKDFASKQALDEAEKAFEFGKAKCMQEKANLEYANIRLGYTRIYAPISGVIGSVATQKGETVSATIISPVFVTIIDLNRLEVHAYVDETDIGRIEVGQKARFTVDTYTDTEFRGKVTAIYPQAEIRNNVVNYIVIIEINKQDDKVLRPEMTTSVHVYTQKSENVIAISNKYLKRKVNKNFVTVLENNQVVEKEVEVGIRGKYKTEITAGLKENELIVINKN